MLQGSKQSTLSCGTLYSNLSGMALFPNGCRCTAQEKCPMCPRWPSFFANSITSVPWSRNVSNRKNTQSISTRAPRTLRALPYWLYLCGALVGGSVPVKSGTLVSRQQANHVHPWLQGQNGADIPPNPIFDIPSAVVCLFEFAPSQTRE